MTPMEQKVEEAVKKIMYEFACVIEALGKDDKSIVEACIAEGHKKHRPYWKDDNGIPHQHANRDL